jgi:hypothetical protein
MSVIHDWIKSSVGSEPSRPAYVWNDWSYPDYFYYPNADRLIELEAIGFQGCRALAFGICEWIVFRCQSSARAPDALDFIDAAWVSMIRDRSVEYVVLDRDEWCGPIDRVLRAAMLITNDSVFDATEDLQFAIRACWAANLMNYIADELHTDFNAWYSTCLIHLTNVAPKAAPWQSKSIFAPRFEIGPPVAPHFLLPGEDFSGYSAEDLLRRHENSIKASNAFYHPPQLSIAPGD